MIARTSYASMFVFIVALVGLSTYAICSFLTSGRSISSEDLSSCSEIITSARVVNLVLVCGTLLALCFLLLNSILLSKTNNDYFYGPPSSKSRKLLAITVGLLNLIISVVYHLAWGASCVFWIWTLVILLSDTDADCLNVRNQSKTLTVFRCQWSPEVCLKSDVRKFYFVLLVICVSSSSIIFLSSIFYLIFGGTLVGQSHLPSIVIDSSNNNLSVSSRRSIQETQNQISSPAETQIKISSPLPNAQQF